MKRGHARRVRFALLLVTLLAGSFAFAAGQGRGGTRVAGRVVEQGSGAPVVMASVVIKDLGLWAVTDDQGRFELANVPAGRQRLEIDLLGYETRTVPVDVKAGLPDLRIELSVASLSLDAVVVDGCCLPADTGRNGSFFPSLPTRETCSSYHDSRSPAAHCKEVEYAICSHCYSRRIARQKSCGCCVSQ